MATSPGDAFGAWSAAASEKRASERPCRSGFKKADPHQCPGVWSSKKKQGGKKNNNKKNAVFGDPGSNWPALGTSSAPFLAPETAPNGPPAPVLSRPGGAARAAPHGGLAWTRAVRTLSRSWLLRTEARFKNKDYIDSRGAF